MKLSIKDAFSVQGDGWFVDPDNNVHSVSHNMGGHKDWLISNWQMVKKYDNTVTENDEHIWSKAFKSGWIRIRIEYDESDMSKPITSFSSVNINLLETLPESMKDIIARTDKLVFIDMNTAASTTYNKDELLKMLHRQRKASLRLSTREKIC